MAQVGRISGPLLTANLERNGIDLAFRNTLDETQLLYLDVNNGLIGVNKDAPGYTLDITGTTRTTNLIVDTSANIADLSINSNNINNLTSNINLNAADSIILSNFATDDIGISDNIISSRRSNSSIDLNPNGTGIVDIFNNLNIDGNLNATGNITFDGSITLGDAIAQDTVTFISDVNSDIIPDQNNTYSLGTPSKKWKDLYSVLLNGQSITTASIAVGPVFLSSRQGNIIYVAENGNDSNRGDHPNGPFKTLKRALDFADASTSGPVTIYVYAGGYEEELPLVVPSNVSVIGEDYRNTFIRPTSADQSKDIFHLNGESTVQNLTITDFYYDSGNDTGYAFRFAPNTVVTTRSPYIQNVTVITKGTTTSASDPRGFASGDAGKGALVDGADVLSASEEASMLFHSVTFITPGVDGLTMTNGVRVEWLNSFTYFANRGLYAVDGVTGHLSTDGSTVKYGAELRSIGSANVYGNYGAVADGSDTLMYLIQHNMAYIGVGKFVDNDPSRVIQSQEVVELNSGKIYYQTVDHFGNFRVGDNFLVDQESGETSLVLTEADIDSLGGMTVTTNGSTTYIDGTRVETGNIRFRDNTITSLNGDINVASASGIINLQNSTNMQKDLSITGNLSFDGSLITVGNDPTDTVNFNTEFTQDLLPDISGFYKLGSLSKTWLKSWLSQAQISDVKIQDNTITTSVSNADLELRANGTGKINLPENNVNLTNNLTVSYGDSSKSGTTTVKDLTITGNVTHTGFRTQLGNYSSPNVTITGNIDTSSQAQFEEILFDGNVIQTTTTNSSLELRASGIGQIIAPLTDVLISNDLSVRDINSSVINVDTTISSVELNASNNIEIRDNYIQTLQTNSDLEFRAQGTGKITSSNPVQIDNNLTVNGNLTFNADLSADDLLGVTDINADQFYAERLHTDDQIEIWDNNISTVVSNSDLELRANSAGGVELESITFEGNILSTGTDDSSSVDINFTSLNGNFNVIATSAIKLPVGTDTNRIAPQSSDAIDGGDSLGIFTETYDGGTASTIFNITDIEIDGGFAAESLGNTGDLRFNIETGIFEGFGVSNIGFGGVYSDDRLTSLTVDQRANNIRMIINGDDDPLDSSKLVATVNETELFAKRIEIDDISFDNNTIRTDISNSNLELRTEGTGEIVIDDITIKDSIIQNNSAYDGSTITTALTIGSTGFGRTKIAGSAGIVVPAGTTIQQPMYSDRIEIANIISVGTTTVIETDTAHGLTIGDEVYISQVESSTDDNLENLNTDDSSSPGSHGIVSTPTTTRLEIAVDTTGANISNYVAGTGYLVARQFDKEPPVGDTRWNTETVVLETWDGEQYITSAGAAEAITPQEFDDLLLEYTLALG